MRFPKRRTFWISTAFLLAVIVGVAWLFAPRSRYDRIHVGITRAEAVAILGETNFGVVIFPIESEVRFDGYAWDDGPNSIVLGFDKNGICCHKHVYWATPWKTLTWYAKKGAAKIGVKWG
jgi:hypothetical protein